HLEAYASGHAATRLAQEAFGPAADAHRLVRLADEGDARARELLGGIGRRLGAGLVTLVNAFDPDLIAIGGGFAAADEWILGPARELVHAESFSDAVPVVRAQLGTAAGLIGAAL